MNESNDESIAFNDQLEVTVKRQLTTSDELRNVLYSLDIATLFLDPELKIRFYTPAIRLLFHIIPSDVGRSLADLRSLAADDELAADAKLVLGGQDPIERELEIPSGGWFLRRLLPYHAHDNRVDGVVITFVDITERKQAAKALQTTKRHAELANLAKSRFLAAASHDLRQPLQSMTLLQDLLMRAVEDEEASKLVVRLGHTLGAMTGMLNALLDINQIEAGVIKPELVAFRIDDLFERLRDEFTYQAQAKRLSLRIVPSSMMVKSDPRLLEQIIRNLMANALTYTKHGKILLGCRRRHDRLRIEIWDTGIGIAANELHSIFEEFHQVDNAARERARGLGLGLSIVQRLGRLLDHEIDVRSEPGKGSAFSISVPGPPGQAFVRNKEGYGTDDTRDDRDDSETHLGKIIIVEDDPEVRELLELLLVTDGHSVRTAADGAAALKLVLGGAIRPEIILADYNLPGEMNGLNVLTRLREILHHELPGIILTGDISTQTQGTIARHNCVQLSKPVQLNELKLVIERLLLAGKSHARLANTRPQRQGSPVIFVVDDDAEVRRSLREALEGDGRIVEDFADAETFLAAYVPQSDACLLLDAYLPGLTGIGLLDRLRRMKDPLPTIVITGSSDVAMAVQAMKAGACDFIEKPVGRVALLASIDRALDLSHDITLRQDKQATAANHLADLTVRQHQVMDLVLAGHPSKNIAADLGISQRTVENHRASIMSKTGAKSLPELARIALAASSGAKDELPVKPRFTDKAA